MITSSKKVTLEWLKKHRDKDPSFWSAVAFEWPALLVNGLVIGVGLWLATIGDVMFGAFLVGAGAAALGTRLGMHRDRLRLFRTYRDVTDWEKVETQLRSD